MDVVTVDRFEDPAAIVSAATTTERYYETDDPAAVLVMGKGPVEYGNPAAGYYLRLLCGHHLFTEECWDGGFGSGPAHVGCPKCAEGVPVPEEAA